MIIDEIHSRSFHSLMSITLFILGNLIIFPIMALNISDKRSLMKTIVPEAELNYNSKGIMITSKRISEARFLPFDQDGCKECMTHDMVIAKEGITVWSSRIDGTRFIPFDRVYDLPGYCFIRIRNKGRVFNIPCGTPDAIEDKPAVFKLPSLQPPPPPPQIPSLITTPPPPPPPTNDDLAQEFFDSLSAATTFMDIGQGRSKRDTENMEEQHIPVLPHPPLPQKIPSYSETQENNFFENALNGRCKKFKPIPEGIEEEMIEEDETQKKQHIQDYLDCFDAREEQIEKRDKFFEDLKKLTRESRRRTRIDNLRKKPT